MFCIETRKFRDQILVSVGSDQVTVGPGQEIQLNELMVNRIHTWPKWLPPHFQVKPLSTVIYQRHPENHESGKPFEKLFHARDKFDVFIEIMQMATNNFCFQRVFLRFVCTDQRNHYLLHPWNILKTEYIAIVL